MIADPRTTALVVVVALVLLAACFAASEAALLALSRLKLLQKNGTEETKSLERLVNDRNLYLTTILVGNTIILLASDSLATWLTLLLLIPSASTIAMPFRLNSGSPGINAPWKS